MPLEPDGREDLKLAIVKFVQLNGKTELGFDYHQALEYKYPYLKYCLETTDGDSGSPILNWNGEVLALHKGEFKINKSEFSEFIKKAEELKINKNQFANHRKGILLKDIIRVFLRERNRCIILAIPQIQSNLVSIHRRAVRVLLGGA